MNKKGLVEKFFISILAVFLLFIGVPQVAYSSTSSIKQRLQHNQVKIKSTREKIYSLKIKEQQEKSKLVKNQKKLETTASDLAESQQRYTNMDFKLHDMENKYAAANREFNNIDAAIKNRIRLVFKTQRTGMFDLLFKAKDLNAMLDTLYFERIVIRNDYNRMVALKVRAAKLAKMKTDIEAQKRSIAQSMEQIKYQKQSIQQAIAQNHSMINRLKTDRAAYERSERDLARQSASLQAMLSSYSHSTVRVSSTGFMKPIGGRITSPFGWRTHPIFKSRTFHSGVDIGGPNYGNIHASNSGKVIYTGWYGGYGKVVIIDHGVINNRPTTTLYAHMSSITVSNGQNVSKGQVIGHEGTTGYSTGPHCHFEVRINGKPNNPLNYI